MFQVPSSKCFFKFEQKFEFEREFRWVSSSRVKEVSFVKKDHGFVKIAIYFNRSWINSLIIILVIFYIIYGFDGWGDWEGGYVMSALLHDIQAYVFSVLLGVRVDPVCTC